MSTLTLLAEAAPMDGPEDRGSIIAAAKAGDLEAFEQLMRQYERMVLVTALRLLGSLHDAQDASQEVFLKLYRNLGKVETSGNISGWLYRVTVNACHDLRRRRPVAVPMKDAGELASREADPAQQSAEQERRRVLQLSLRMLSEKERAALVLRDLEGLTTEEVARVLGSSEATVRSQISKARVKVKGFVERYFRRHV
ncbi:RNA polymerase, sigma-24 subunit, ECF subfamily [Candidatus Sulfopaludibacter sp. SbA6]|nr:RNA polymerase, sigma-24 subunit, ECF subfamily [Candidatus Sulfopaludibacter sp. SbA6]